jgi:hypothetical protein
MQVTQLIPISKLPEPDSPLPSDLSLDDQFPSKLSMAALLDSPQVIHLNRPDIGYFARHAQSSLMLDRLLRVIRQPSNEGAWYLELKELDDEVQSFLSVLMSEERWARRFGCGAIASCIRFV